jgi:hypothetical protein
MPDTSDYGFNPQPGHISDLLTGEIHPVIFFTNISV